MFRRRTAREADESIANVTKVLTEQQDQIRKTVSDLRRVVLSRVENGEDGNDKSGE
jgi:signal transduction histidine kinase